MIENDDYVNKIIKKTEEINDIELKKLIYKLIDERNNLINTISLDPLTGAYNRRKLDHIRNYSVVVMCDIDKFKTINDTFGHDVGDEILKIVAHTLINHTRITDFVVRFGGDEFLIVFVGCDENIVVRRMNETQNEIKNKIKLDNFDITLSVGISKNNDNKSLYETIKEADEALYISKQYRNNTITVYKPKELTLK